MPGAGVKTVLAVDDNEESLRLMACIVERTGHRLILARSGEEAVALAKRQLPDLILMDIKLPGIDGLEATRRIRESLPMVPIIAVTAHAMTGDRERFLAAGCNFHLEKPIDPVAVLARIGLYLERGGPATPAGR